MARLEAQDFRGTSLEEAALQGPGKAEMRARVKQVQRERPARRAAGPRTVSARPIGHLRAADARPPQRAPQSHRPPQRAFMTRQ